MQPEGFQELIATCHSYQEGHLSQWPTPEELAGLWGSPLNVLSMTREVNCISLRNA